jgi:hypothetical protein
MFDEPCHGEGSHSPSPAGRASDHDLKKSKRIQNITQRTKAKSQLMQKID